MWNLKTLTSALSAMALAILLISPITAAAQQVDTKLLSVTPDGKNITFKGADGNTVKSKVSGSRTMIMIGGKNSDRKNLKAGMSCMIMYKMDGKKNEPSMVHCK